jgi:hypothetical protein
MIARALTIITVLALSTYAAAAQHRHHVHRAVLHHRAIPADAFAQAGHVAQSAERRALIPEVGGSSPPVSAKTDIEVIPLPRQRPFDLIWYDRVTSVIGGR